MTTDVSDKRLAQTANQLQKQLLACELVLSVAESCTGGWVAKLLTDINGSSEWFERGFVTYSNLAKQQMLGVNPATLQRYGAVSEQTVQEMAQGAITHSMADISLSISGVAGPGGGSIHKPVGLVWFAWCQRDKPVLTEKYVFSGDRDDIRRQAVDTALKGVVELVTKPSWCVMDGGAS